MKRRATDLEKIFVKLYLTKDLYLEYVKNSYNSIRRESNWKMKQKWAKDLNKPFNKGHWMASKYMKRHSTPLSPGQCKSVVVASLLLVVEMHHYMAARMTRIKIKMRLTKHGWGWGTVGARMHGWWECRMVQPLWGTFWQMVSVTLSRVYTWKNLLLKGYMLYVSNHTAFWKRQSFGDKGSMVARGYPGGQGERQSIEDSSLWYCNSDTHQRVFVKTQRLCTKSEP